ncbi:type II secretion system F family protein [Actinoplanes sp. NPDC049599]|uniref:type II secretion system F family protein n=1 Tax=Actinoplanes sp. NPDC049599 TaxID=3363903 RepID=UPI00378AF001
MVLLAGLGSLAGAVVVLVLTFLGGDRNRADVTQALAALRSPGPAESVAPRDRPLGERLGALGQHLGRIGGALTPAAAIARLQRQLDYAGNPAGWPVQRVVPLKGIGLAAGAVAGGLSGLLFGGAEGALFGTLPGAAAGFLLPDLLVYNLGLKRQQELLLSLPDVLDTLVISVEAGLGFDAAMAQVAQHGKGPMAREMVRVLREMQIGAARGQALRALAARTTVAELRTFVTAVVQSGDLGVPIAGVLREHAREMRLRRRQRAEELAQKVPIKILFPVLFCLFPSLFVVILGPGVLQIMDAFAP